jgi:hypothetical protein
VTMLTGEIAPSRHTDWTGVQVPTASGSKSAKEIPELHIIVSKDRPTTVAQSLPRGAKSVNCRMCCSNHVLQVCAQVQNSDIVLWHIQANMPILSNRPRSSLPFGSFEAQEVPLLGRCVPSRNTAGSTTKARASSSQCL